MHSEALAPARAALSEAKGRHVVAEAAPCRAEARRYNENEPAASMRIVD